MERNAKKEAEDAGDGDTMIPKTGKSGELLPVGATGDYQMSELGKTDRKKKLVRVRLSQEQIDRMLSVPEDTRPFPVVTEAELARIRDPALRESFGKAMANAAELFYKSREEIKREQQYAREELAALGYVEREMEVTDDEAEEDFSIN
ncbi:hypothetical protein PR202_gb09025 [Eleusine coracana subsp. coracana]|uniref:Uncharacterized protein n=1 Tax=Eleusine coracana subsp. coracana TaxID=191504 RepID=A0AAV5EGI9_ELECO|nr:hypothetical protein PR202_gb09025 [Eleusine coracana subsp. coracana]